MTQFSQENNNIFTILQLFLGEFIASHPDTAASKNSSPSGGNNGLSSPEVLKVLNKVHATPPPSPSLSSSASPRPARQEESDAKRSLSKRLSSDLVITVDKTRTVRGKVVPAESPRAVQSADDHLPPEPLGRNCWNASRSRNKVPSQGLLG